MTSRNLYFIISHHMIRLIDSPVTNLPKIYPWYKRLGSNITYYISQIPLRPRKNNLTKSDIRKVWKIIQRWDIILCGNFQHISGLFIDWVVTHAIGHLHKWKCIHAYAHGVSHIHLRHILRTYDTLILIRPRWETEEQIVTYIQTLKSHLGKPYDFFFGLDTEYVESYFCTKLINESLLTSGYDTWLESIEKTKNIIDISLDTVYRAHRVLTPDQMIYGNFDIVCTSENIEKHDDTYIIRGGKITEIIPEIKNLQIDS